MTLNLGQHTAVRSPRSPRRQAAAATEAPVYTIDPHVEKKIAPLIAKLRDLALRRGDGAFRDVGTLLGVGRAAAVAKGRRANTYNPNESVKLNPDAFQLTIAQFGIVLTTADVNMLLLAFKDSVGYMVVSHFIQHLTRTMNGARAAVVAEAFASLPRSREGLASVPDMVDRYCPAAHPLVADGRATAENVLRAFAEAFEGPEKAPNAEVSEEEFVAYYSGISYGIADDAAFVAMVRDLWDLYPKPPPPAVERCFVPAPNSPSGERWTTTTTTSRGGLGGSPNRSPLRGRDGGEPHTVVGYTGHIPGAVDHFGQSFAATQQHVGGLSAANKKARYVPQPGERIDEPLKLRPPNKANNHNHTFA